MLIICVKSGTLSAHLSGKVKSEVKGRPPRFTVEEEKMVRLTSLQPTVSLQAIERPPSQIYSGGRKDG